MGCIFLAGRVEADPGSALQFDGVNGYVQVAHNTNLNAFPITVSAWFRSTNFASLAQGIVSKYLDGSGNGWSLLLQNGNLRGFYYRLGGASSAMDATTAAVVSDGFWHHAAMTVDTNGGKLYLDGALVGSGTWNGISGPPNGTEPLQIGRYYNYPTRILGTIDEVTVWDRALGSTELNYLKHRHLNGNEDGLVAAWHLDENGGTNAMDATGHGYTGTLVSNPVWVASSAPLVLNQVAGNALSFSGGTDYVTVPTDPAFDTFPLTIMAWVRTSRNSANADGIVSKYVDASDNGYSMFLYNGHLRAWYFHDTNNYVWDHGLGIDGGAIADGQWHHLAFVVDGTSGRLYVDGAQTGFLNWFNTPGPPSNSSPFQIGRYYNYPTTLLGLADEVSVWKVALTPSQLATYKNTPLTGSESGLVSLWRLNESSGTTAHDLTLNGHDGILTNGPVWTGSTAFLGDGTTAIQTTLGTVTWARQFAVHTIPAQRGFLANAPFWARRLDDFGATGGVVSASVTIQSALQSTLLSGPVPLTNNSAGFSFGLAPYLAAVPQPTTGGFQQNASVGAEPEAGTQIDSVIDTIALGVTESLSVNSGPAVPTDTANLAPQTVLHFDGNLFFGSFATIFTSIANTPTRGTIGGGGINTLLAINSNSGYLVSKPDHTYGTGLPMAVVLHSNGDATTAATVSLNGPVPDTDCIQNICFQRANMLLTPTGGLAKVTLNLPIGFSIGAAPTNHITSNTLAFVSVPLDTNLEPTNTSLSYNSPLYAAGEMMPYWFSGPGLTWQIGAGQIVLSPNGGAFVRQQEDDILLSQQATLTDPSAAIRVSNDGYFRNATPAGGSLIVLADSNGVARVNTQLSLSPPELRPHFPYSGLSPGSQIPTTTGLLVITDNLAGASSYLNVSGPVPVSYGRDCNYLGCTAAQAGPATLSFTANGDQLGFTPDGGLLAFGSVPASTLSWGYATGGNFAQQAGTVTAGAYRMAGTFLRADQTTLADAQRPTVILFTGFGNDSDPTYIERPDQAAYILGYGNYPGLNFRSPAQGSSYIGQHSLGPFPLDPVSKYYVRFGGVNGIQQSAAAPGPLPLYGYNFTFSSYGLSYLDGQNWESRTDGAVTFPPQPAGFTQEFERMKLTCRGDLSSANIPTGLSPKKLNYWNVSFTPQSIDFHPTNNDTCGTSPRFLVLGVETTLPFIPQALHGALGFKTNGNLVTISDNVSNVDSRFPVPAQLNVQGPGNTVFTFSTVAKGYFNNWDNPDAKNLSGGFYNLAGKLRVPFFEDIKAHLQITPTGPNSSDMSMMGGWPAANSAAPDMGWSVNNSNFFNQVDFDPNADGWPRAQGVSLTSYQRDGPKYRPRAQRDWIQVATFDYPLTYHSVLHSFSGFEAAKVELPVIDVDSKLRELAPGKVDFDFAQDISLQLPRIKVLDFVNDALNGNIGPLITVSNAIRDKLGATLDATGINKLTVALREDARNFFDPILAATLDPLITNVFFPQIATLQQTNVAAFLQQVYNIINTPAGPLQNAIAGLNNISNQASSVVLTLDQTLTDVLDTAGLLDRVLAKDPASGNRKVIATIVEKLVSDQGPAINIFATVGDQLVDPYLADIDSTLSEIQSDLEEVSNQIAQAQSELESVTGDFRQTVGSAIQDATGLSQFLQTAAADVTNYLASSLTPAGDLFTANPAAVQRAIRQEIATAFLSSALPGNYQQAFRQFLGDNNFVLDQLMDQLFDQINGAIRNSLTDQIKGAQDGLFGQMKGAGLLGGSLLSAKIRGAPTFNGDSLREIHLNADIQMNMPDKMNFNAYMDIKELTSETTPIGCIPAGAPAAEVTLGAKNVPLGWAGVTSGQSAQSLTLSADARWTLQGGSVIGIGGTLDIGGSASFEGCSLKDLGATLAIGPTENYFAAKVDATVPILGIPVNMKAGFFAGHACSLDPLKYVDPEADQVLINKPQDFTGVYVQYGGGFSLSDLLGFGDLDCLLNAGATISTAYYFQGGASLGTIGGRQKVGVDISLLCVLSGHLDYAQFLALDTSGKLTVGGSADVCGSVGPCLVCVSGCKGITIKGVVTTHGVDYFVDY